MNYLLFMIKEILKNKIKYLYLIKIFVLNIKYFKSLKVKK